MLILPSSSLKEILLLQFASLEPSGVDTLNFADTTLSIFITRFKISSITFK